MAEEQEKQPIDYIDLTLKQVVVVEQAADLVRNSPAEESSRQLEIELEKLCFYQTAARGEPKTRAQQAAESARNKVLGRAIKQK